MGGRGLPVGGDPGAAPPPLPPMAPAGLILILILLCTALGSGAPPSAATPVWCFSQLEEAEGGGACTEPLVDEPVPLADCCLNPAYGYKLRPHGHCLSCREGEWGPWAPWSHCSVPCEEGTQRRGRGRSPGGDSGDSGDTTEWQLRACHMPCCAVAGGWSQWSPWGSCSVTCGTGTQRRSRTCSDPAPKCGGSCGPGDPQDSRECNGSAPVCPVAGAWGPWGPWGACSGSCRGSGPEPRRSRRRRCDAPEPSREPPGAPCAGSATDSEPCPGLRACPVDGAWGAWSPAPPCPVTCGLGGVVQSRSCDAPSPKHGGRDCAGSAHRRAPCKARDPCPAPVHWGPWSPWSVCERPFWGDIHCTRTSGLQQRTRGCVGLSPGGPPCPTDRGGGTIQVRACYSIHGCIMQGNWSEWSPWGLCTPPCGASPTRSRSRECRPILPDYDSTLHNVGTTGTSNVTFWGAARPLCPPLMGQKLRLEETRPCLNVRPCPKPDDD